ncbi:HTH-type transcriptional repressor CytR [bioreactor metagenome]|uniref:HTH-type transcriptional repressor CytR n=1 Tax=bioreactor metagenome TaxID=1076179 RepID=A0A645F5Y7_9ZZZZ
MRRGVCDAVSFLLAQGRRRIAVFETFDERDGYVHCRLEGVRDAFARFGVESTPELIRRTPLAVNAGYGEMKQLLREGVEFDAVFGGYDLSCFGIMRALKEAGIRVPEEVAVIGSDDLPQCREQVPPLATVRYPMHEMGGTMCRLLAEAIRNPAASPESRELKCEFIIRESAGKAIV